MRKTTLLWLVLAVVASAVLFHTSQKVGDGRQHLAELQKNIKTEEESIRVLQAEWSYLNQPERLEKLAKQYLELAPMSGRQFAKAADIEKAPPPVAENTPPLAENTKATLPAAEVRKIAPKIIKPVSPPPVAQKTLPKKPVVVQTKAPAKPPVREASKDFSDLMKNLGVQ